ncbi:MAG TPA: PAS domain S-box protein [Azospirillaceae bacterium]|nr:PAS domain S-box protein [Azospirillaceae bacterium]
MHRLLERQIAKAKKGRADGSIDVDALLALVAASYEEADKERRLAARAVEEMEREMRALAEQARSQGEALLKGVLEAVGDGVVLSDHRGVIVDVNAAVERLFGYTRDELIGRDLAVLMGEDDAKRHPGWVADYNRDRIVRIIGRTRELLARRRDGSTFPIELAVGDLSSSGVRRFVGIVRDITERLRVKREIEDSRQRFQDFAEASSDWMWETDADHRFTLFAGNRERAITFDPEKSLGKTRLELMAAGAPADLIAKHRADLEARQPFREFVYPMTQGGGRVRHLRVSGRPVFDGDGAFRGYRGTASDITDALAAEERMAALERQLSAAISSMSEGFVLYDRDHRVVACNDRYRDFYPQWAVDIDAHGALPDLLRLGAARGLYDMEGRDLEDWVAWRMASHRRADGEPILLRLADGRVFRVRERATPDGGVVGVHSDVTAELALQRQLQDAKDAAEGASRAKSEFLAVMSHEIRTPMNGVIGMTGLLLTTSLSEEQKHFAVTIRDSAECLLAIINDILDYSKVEAGRMDFESADFDVATLVESVVEILAPRALGKGVEIASFVDPSARLLACGDAGRVRQILMNLAGNAVKFTDEGWVTIEVAAVAADEAAGNVRLRFTVADTGVGIEEEAQAKLFGMFMQADGSSTRRHGGSGLGLAISRRLAELMGGAVGFASVYGEGSTFWFEIPLAVRGRSSAAADLRGARLLVVDDLEVNRDFLQRRLGAAGAVVETADSVDAALAALERAAGFDAVITDEAMPGGSGVHLASLVRGDARWRDTPMVLASSRGVLQITGDHQGLDAVVHKPLRDAVLFSTLGRLLNRLPEAAPVQEASDSPGSAAALGRALRLLVVEDNAVNQQVALGVLRRLDHTVDVAGDGIEALEAVRQRPYDIIFMDVRMPRMDGLEATRRIRQLSGPAARTPIIAMTAGAMQGDEAGCLEAGMDGFLAKPIDRRKLYEALERFAGSSMVKSQAAAADGAADGANQAAGVVAVDGELDIEALDDLTDVLGVEDVAHLVRRFLEDAPKRLQSMRAASNVGDIDTAAREAHSIKGASGSMGMRRVEAAAAALEKRLRSGDDIDCAAAAAGLEDLIAAGAAALDVYFAARPPGD